MNLVASLMSIIEKRKCFTIVFKFLTINNGITLCKNVI